MDDQASSIHTDGAAESTPKAKHQSDISHSTVIQPQAQVSAPPISSLRKALLLLLFSLAQFIDTCNVAEMISALPTVSSALKFQSDESVWLVSTYQLTFSSFLLMGGRLSDVYNPKYVFNIGFGVMGLLSLGSGLVKDDAKIGILVLRAITGVFAAFTIPSALNLIVHLWPDPVEQERAISIFAVSGALGNMLGLIIGAVFTQLVSWRWIFFFNAIIALPTALICSFVIPRVRTHSPLTTAKDFDVEKDIHALPAAKSQTEGEGTGLTFSQKLRRLDVPGIFILTSAALLFIFAIVSGSQKKWDSPRVLAPLILSGPLLLSFLWYESKIKAEDAIVPPRMWRYKNLTLLFIVSLYPYFWFSGLFILQTTYFQQNWHWNPIISAVHFLPVGLTVFIAFIVAVTYVQQRFSSRSMILLGGVIVIPGTILFTRTGLPSSHYWPYLFPGMILGTFGISFVFLAANVGIIAAAPPEESGVAGGLFNAGLQLGSALGASLVTTIQENIDAKQENPFESYKGREIAYWFVLALLVVEVLAVIVFYKPEDAKKGAGEEGDRYE